MEIPHRAGQSAAALGTLMLAVGALANIILMPVNIVGIYGGVRALRVWNVLDSDAPLWAGVAFGCSLLITGVATLSGVLGWMIWAWATTALLAISLFGARDHVARRHRNWQLQRALKSDPESQHPQRRATPTISDQSRKEQP
jgi:hypothetical protein